MNEVQNTGNTGKGLKDTVKNFLNKDFGMFKGLHIVCAAAALLVLVVVIAIILKGGKKPVEYPVVFVNEDGKLMLMKTNMKKEEKAIKLSSDNASITYANTTDRYILLLNSGTLSIYDSKSKDVTSKIKSDVTTARFTKNDKYVVYVTSKDGEKTLYAYNYKDSVSLESGIGSLLDYTDKYALYTKDDNLYIELLTGKKDKIKVASDVKNADSARFSKDGKRVIYLDSDKDLHTYKISNKKDTKVASEVTRFYASEDGTKFYYVKTEDKENNIYYYNGKSSKKVVSDYRSIESYNVDKQLLLYTQKDGDKKEALYFKKGTKDAAKVEDDLEDISADFDSDFKAIYYTHKDGSNEALKYAKISGAKTAKAVELSDNVSGLTLVKGGVAYIADAKDNKGTLYIAKGKKAKKIDDDVSSDLTVSYKGNKIYYGKDCSSKGTCDLYVTSGSKGKKIDSEVNDFAYITDKVLYYTKDYSSSTGKADLYRYTGKSTKIAEDIKELKTRSQNTYYKYLSEKYNR